MQNRQPASHQGLWRFIFSNFDTIGGVVKILLPSTVVGAIVSWATWLGGVFQQNAPASWVYAGIAGALLTAIIMLIAAMALERFQLVRFRNGVFSSTQINPLDPIFTSRRIRFVDLAPPVGGIIENKTFIDCDLIGPFNLAFDMCTFQQNSGQVVDALLVKKGLSPLNGLGFRSCTFQRCRFYLVTFLVQENEYDLFEHTHRGLNWITEKPNPSEEKPAIPAVEK